MPIYSKLIEDFEVEVAKETEKVLLNTTVYKILIVVGNPDRLMHTDYVISSALLVDRDKFDIQIVDDSDSQNTDAIGKDLVIITDSVSSNNVLAKFRDVTTKVLVFERAIARDMQMADSEGGTFTQSDGKIEVLNSTHPFFDGFEVESQSQLQLIRAGARFYQVEAAANASILANRIGDANGNVLFYFNTGDIGRQNFAFPGSRFFFGLERSSNNLIDVTARFLFNLIKKILTNEYSL